MKVWLVYKCVDGKMIGEVEYIIEDVNKDTINLVREKVSKMNEQEVVIKKGCDDMFLQAGLKTVSHEVRYVIQGREVETLDIGQSNE